MADEKFLPPERPPIIPALAHGATRASAIVELDAWPAVARRRDLNERLLDATCAFTEGGGTFTFSADDLDLLLLATQERFGSTGSLLRRRAVAALGQLDADAAVSRLVELLLSPVEHDQVRLTALAALPPDRAGRMYGELVEDPSEAVREQVRRLIGEVRPERRAVPGQVGLDPEVGLDDRPSRCQCRCCCC